MMYLYAITDRPEAPVPAGPSLEEASPLSLSYRGIAAVVSPLIMAEVPLTAVNLWRHEAVVRVPGRSVRKYMIWSTVQFNVLFSYLPNVSKGEKSDTTVKTAVPLILLKSPRSGNQVCQN